MPARSRLPAVLVLALATQLTLLVALPVMWAVISRGASVARFAGWLVALSPIVHGLALITLLGYAAGAWALGDQVDRRATVVARIAAVGFGAAAALASVDLLAMAVTGEHALVGLQPFQPQVIDVAVAGLCCACIRRARPGTVILAALAILLAAASTATTQLGHLLALDPPNADVTVRGLLDFALAIVSTVQIARVRPDLDATPAELGPRGLRATGNALFARIAVIVSAAPLAVVAGAVPGSPQRYAGDALLLGAVAVSLALAACLSRAARWSAEAAPRYRLAVSAGLVGWAAFARLATTARLRDPRPFPVALDEHRPDLAWLPSVIDLAGLVLVASAIAATARVLGAPTLADRASRVSGLLAVLIGGSIAMQTVRPDSTPTWLILAIGSMLAAGAATWALARAARDLPVPEVAAIPVAVARNA